MSDIKISVCCSAIHTECWEKALNSLKNNIIQYEVIFVGNIKPQFNLNNYPEFKYIYSEVKPSQCYEIAFRSAKGELLMWTADDATYDPNSLDNLWAMYQAENNDKLVMEVRPVEDGREITSHTFKGGDTPHMAPFGVVNTKKFHELGGYDRQFICGQAENDIVMKFYEIGGTVKTCQGAIARVQHNEGHSGLSVFRGGVDGKHGYYGDDRKVLEPLWINEEGMRLLTGVKAQDDRVNWANFMSKIRRRPVDRYEGTIEDLIKESQGQKGHWL